MYLASFFYNSAVKNNNVGGRKSTLSERAFMIWRFLCSLRCSNSLQVSTRVSAESESAPAARCYTLLICARFHGRRATCFSFHKEITERDKWRHVCIWEQLLLLPTPHSTTHTNKPKHTRPAQNISCSETMEGEHGFCQPSIDSVQYLR